MVNRLASIVTALAALLLLTGAPSALGYAGQVPANVTITGPQGALACADLLRGRVIGFGLLIIGRGRTSGQMCRIVISV